MSNRRKVRRQRAARRMSRCPQCRSVNCLAEKYDPPNRVLLVCTRCTTVLAQRPLEDAEATP